MNTLKFIDLFCGAGGVTTGIENAVLNGKKIAQVIACVNHDPIAIQSHTENYPNALHLTEDIRKVKLSIIKDAINKQVSKKDLLCLWASIECTNYSKAKGGQPKDADSRTLPNSLFRYINVLNPDFIFIENVEEFMSWGPLDENGKPISKYEGKDYLKWVNKIKKKGYIYDWRILNSADYGAYTARKRYFGIFAKHGFKIQFPEPTHTKTISDNPIFIGKKTSKWKPVREVLDLDDKGTSIFDRKIPLVEKTLQRILAGLQKFVANEHPDFIQKYHGKGKNVFSVNECCSTLTTRDRIAIVRPIHFIQKTYSGKNNIQSIDRPAGAILTNDKHALVTAFLYNPQYGSNSWSINRPCFTLIARMDKAPPYIVFMESGVKKFEIKETDSPTMCLIKIFMREHGIIDIKMRMVKISELGKIQGFPDHYIFKGTQTHVKKFIGNSVPPVLPEKLALSTYLALNKYEKRIA